MKDLQKWKDFLDSFNIAYSEQLHPVSKTVRCLYIESNKTASHVGYDAAINFEDNGKFDYIEVDS